MTDTNTIALTGGLIVLALVGSILIIKGVLWITRTKTPPPSEIYTKLVQHADGSFYRGYRRDN